MLSDSKKAAKEYTVCYLLQGGCGGNICIFTCFCEKKPWENKLETKDIVYLQDGDKKG